jgi:uncharacterized protein YbjQ (UPF0145 family)
VSPEVAPGWYPDPQAPGQVRYWDGAAWTEHVQPGGDEGDEESRVEELRDSSFFTSDLSPGELLLLAEAGFEPLGVVSGTAIYQIGFEASRWTENGEIAALSKAMLRGRELALERAADDAAELGADGVVSLRAKVGGYEWAPNMAEFVVIGTAVRRLDGEDDAGRPFTTDLSGQEIWTLRRAGYRPLGLALGTFVLHIAYANLAQLFRQYGANAEIADYSNVLAGAREQAMRRAQDHARRLGADGVVGVELKERSHQGWGSHVIEFFASGTAVAATGEPPPDVPAQPVVPLGR